MKRLRPPFGADDLAAIYSAPHDHRLYGRGHGERVEETIRVGKQFGLYESVADLSCGNGEIARALHPNPILGDFAPGYPIRGRIEDTVDKIDPVDLFVCCETLEHLHSPKGVVAMIAEKCNRLLLSTPVENWGDTNAEHYWAWSMTDVTTLLNGMFRVRSYSEVDSREYGEPYCYGVWYCEKVKHDGSGQDVR